MREALQRELAQATAELKAHMATWEYAFAMGASCHGGNSRTERLTARCRDLRARLAEHDL
jgi:hypothetical protein